MNWKDSLLNRPQMESEVPLRFGKSRLFVSTLAAQLFCEQKVDFEEQFGKEELEVQKVGTEIHDTLVPTEVIPTEQLIKHIEEKKTITSIFPTRYETEGIVISGIHDGLIFRDGKPLYLLEIKTTRNPNNLKKTYPGERFQAFLYALSLEQMGFDISGMKIVIPKVLQDVQRESIVEPLIRYLDGEENALEQEFNSRIRIHKYSLTLKRRDKTLETISDLVAYWREERKPRGASSYIKCKFCQFNTSCPKSLFRPLDKGNN